MPKLTINLILAGNTAQQVNTKTLGAWRSELFTIGNNANIHHLPDPDGTESNHHGYPDHQLRNLFRAADNADLTIAIISSPIEHNLFMRHLGGTLAVLSLYEMRDIVTQHGYSVEHFILRMLYPSVCLARINPILDRLANCPVHAETRGCIFDYMGFKRDIIFSMHKPRVCTACQHELAQHQLPEKFSLNLENELRKLKQPAFTRMKNWVECHPYISIGITCTTGVVLNLASSWCYDLLRTWNQ